MSAGARVWWWWRPRSGGAVFRPPEPPAMPAHDLLWGDGAGITWGGDTIIDWPVI